MQNILRVARFFFLSSNLCLQLTAVEHISLACNVTVALWRSVEWWCCVGKIAGGGCPTYPITTDVHHTSQSALSKRHITVGSEKGESTERSERSEDRCFGVNKAVGDWQQTGRCMRPSWRCMPTTSHSPWRNQSRSERAFIKTSWTLNTWVMLSVLGPLLSKIQSWMYFSALYINTEWIQNGSELITWYGVKTINCI